jgi:hypothetical protein
VIASPEAPSWRVPRTYIARALQRGRVSHAYLLLGAEGSGVGEFALEIAMALFCTSPRFDGSAPLPCGDCSECRRALHDNHPGIERYGPDPERRVVDIQTVRALCERSHLRRSHAFVAILERADLMNEPAANAILKTLEEPPGHFVLLLTSPAAGALLPTIVSRCHRLWIPARPASHAERSDAAVLDEAGRPGFLARTDVREWLGRAAPEVKTARDQARVVLDDLIAAANVPPDGADLSSWVERLATLLELRGAVDRNVSADLIIEQVLARVVSKSQGRGTPASTRSSTTDSVPRPEGLNSPLSN